MKLIPGTYELISGMKDFFQISNPDKKNYLNEEPLRAELFNTDQFEHFGKTLAATHSKSDNPAKEYLLKRLEENEIILHKVRKLLNDSIKDNHLITPAGEWLIDNFYLLEEHIRNAKIHFPKGYSENLPQLSNVQTEGATRIYDIVQQIISHSDGRIDIVSLSGFIKAYQSVTPLQLGELWAIPIMLRLALIENIRRVSARIAIDRIDRNLADYWANKMFETVEKDSADLILIIAEMARSNPPMSTPFVSEFSRQLRGKGPDLAMALHWIEQQLAKSGLTSLELVNAENQNQAADQVSISNSINSLRILGLMDWTDFVEEQSIVEQTLRQDHNGVYARMDFNTRDRYRHVVEYIAKKSERSEFEVAQIAIRLAQEKVLGNDDARTAHVGYYLIGQGVIQTKKLAEIRESGFKRFGYLVKRHAFLAYVLPIGLITFIISAGIILKTDANIDNKWLLGFIALLTILSVSQLAISVVNFLSSLFVKPRLLPRMDFSKSIPETCRTLVVIPVMLTNEKEIESLVEALEVRFLANRNKNLHFGLLTDFTDAAQEILPEDQPLIDLARQRIEDLNKKYQRKSNDLFYLFHRPRTWNPQENCWMGYERKRGKLAELNSFLRGGAKDRFSIIIGNASIFPQLKYIITLDADTQLPLGSAWKLIGSMAHPLNHAWYDAKKKRVTRGYGILQPRVTISLPGATTSRYSRMHGNEPGLDPYTRATSDVYQDLFSEGSYIGKGIYEIDIFRKVLEERFSENSILSHDLLEGCYVRSGLLSDVQLYEKYPTSYREDRKRVSRWIRGDWQILLWMFPIIVNAKGHWRKNPISGISRWKIFDNIRRSLVPLALTALIILGWIVLPSTLFWTITVSGIIVVPIIMTSIWETFRKSKDVILLHHIKNSVHTIADVFVRTSFTLVSLPYEAVANLITITGTLWRVLISRKKLLEWNSSTIRLSASEASLIGGYSFMLMEPLLAVMVFVSMALLFPIELFIAAPILILWVGAPFIIWWMSKPLMSQAFKLTLDQTAELRKMARKTWSFFEEFVNPENNWLPPDNFQEQPVSLVAHRTSPTNIGLSLLANITARDFGYITNTQFIERTNKTMSTMQRMERYQGHFYNWYDTKSLAPLLPKYISTVDSGNLAGHLLVLRQEILSIPRHNIVSPALFTGLLDTLRMLSETFKGKNNTTLEQFKIDLEAACAANCSTHEEVVGHLATLHNSFSGDLEALHGASDETSRWRDILKDQLDGLNEELQIFKPWSLLKSVPAKFETLASINENATWSQLVATAKELQTKTKQYQVPTNTPVENEWLALFETSLSNSIQRVDEQISLTETLARQCNDLADMKWNFLYNKSNNLFTIGFNVKEQKMDAGFYDLLASEARLGSFVCIAQGKIPVENWFAMGRLLTNVDGGPILLSWSGSMFEYLMPLLIMPTYENTLLDQTYKAAVQWQIDYGKKMGTFWGISESGYNMINASSHYQYNAFGAPGLGLKRGLEEDSVIAPYASALALMVDPEEAYKNLKQLRKEGFEGRYGFYEAIDYTKARLQRGQTRATIYSYMAHHQAMSLLAMAHLLLDKPMQKLFEAEPQFKAALLLLQERIPRATVFYAHTTDIADVGRVAVGTESRVIHMPNTPAPEVQLLSNGRYHAMITNAGGGYSHWKNIAVTRWREDATRDNWGSFCYIRDLDKQVYWSNTHQPTIKKEEKYEVTFSIGRADFHSVHNEIETRTEIVVSPEDDIEMRRIHVVNRSDIRRSIDITSYAEVVLAPAASDMMQPSFSNLFVQTEILPLQHAILCKRRPRSAEETSPVMFHLMTMQGKIAEDISYESDRMEFIGRGNTSVNPQAMNKSGPLAGNQGSVLDPIVAIRYKIVLEPDETVTLDMVTGIGDTVEICKSLIGKYQDKHHTDRVFELAWTHSQVVLRQINASEAEAQLFGKLAGSLLFNNAAFRADPSVLINNNRQQSGLWGYSISGDLPIVLLRIEKQSNMQLAKQLVTAHAYWRLKGLAADLVIWHEGHNGYRQIFQNEIQAIIPDELKDKRGGIFVRALDQISNEDRILFQTVARIIISDSGGTLEDQVNRIVSPKVVIPYFSAGQKSKISETPIPLPTDLIFFNGIGGFNNEGTEYVMIVDEHTKTPAPWVNVIANPDFGTVISESGSAYTWTENAHEFRLTPWKNDPVSDAGGEAFYIRDEDNGHFWSTALLPAGGKTPYITRHGFGYSVFEHLEDGIYSEMMVYVDSEAPVKFVVIKIRNQSGRPRKLSATGYTEWVLDNNRSKAIMHICTEVDPDSEALFAKNPYNNEFNKRVAFFDVDYSKKSFTADRAEFIGRNGTQQNPEAMSRQKLSGRTGLALDPCAAIQVPLLLADGEEERIVFRLGIGKDGIDASRIVHQFRGIERADESLEKVKKYWKHTLGALQVETPDVAINMITNGWLTYQTLSSRLWGRSGFYQSGGAFGFRDQLQDVLSLLHAAPQLARKQIVLCASRQFKEGDVQHWWHPPVGRGVRTRISDDFLWLPFVTSYYILRTGDREVLDESVPFLEGRLLNPGEDSYFDLPAISSSSGSLYEHCVRAIKHGLRFGEHGLPLIGTGDWNDGFDKVGSEGKGESVWMGFFLYEILIRFSKTARSHNDSIFADECIRQAQQLKINIEKNAWDGQWYKRAWFDDGTPLGSSTNEECKIDSIAQSWSVLSEVGDSKRVNTAMESAYKHLVQKDVGIIKLLTPAFDKSDLNPGYIKGYVPGIRENGGQYTHAAVWLTMAFAKLKDNKRVWELLTMINPINHGKTPETIATYKVEPYVLSADVYAGAQHPGRGGWTWYTGSAGWLYRLIIESFLGIEQEGSNLKVNPCIPDEWESFKVHYRYRGTVYHIEVIQTRDVHEMMVTVDYVKQDENVIALIDDGQEHHVEILLRNDSAVHKGDLINV